MQMAEGLDTGPVYLRHETDISADETAGSLHDRLADMGAAALLDCLGMLAAGSMPEPVGQDDRQATYAKKLDKAEAHIDWNAPAVEIERRIRAFSPWPVCWSEIQGERLRIWRADAVAQSHSFKPGTVISTDQDGIVIAAGGGLVRLLEVQRAGGRRMPASEFLKAHPLRTGE
jgi:methionyl-tRNA formyltransferase